MSLIQCSNLSKSYIEGVEKGHDKIVTPVLSDLNFSITAGEQVAILGQSGSGKSTLLHLLGLLDSVESGQLFFDGEDVSQYDETKRAQYRNDNMGFIYQFHHLLMEFSAVENVAMPLLIKGTDKNEATKQALFLLEQVGLSHRTHHLPSQMSGGERQRVAIARALINNPKIVLADEPTGNLDKSNAEQIFKLFVQLNQKLNTTLIVVTHDEQMANRFGRVVRLANGKIQEPQS
jgi:lipoprotein-releasing system ATP-binding protein